MSSGPLVVIGDSLLDRDVDGRVSRVCPDAPVPVLDEAAASARPGGAALAAALAARVGYPAGPPVTLVTALGTDDAAYELAGLLDEAGVEVVAVPAQGATAEKIRLRAGDQTLLRLDRGVAQPRLGPVPERVRAVAAGASAILVADYGRGLAARPAIRSALAGAGRPIVWDPHPRGPEPVPGCRVLTPNASELLARFPEDRYRADLHGLTAAARAALSGWAAAGVAVTRGALGALLVSGDGPPLAVPARPAPAGDACGAGDCFAASLTVHLGAGALPSEAVTEAVADAGRFVAAGGASGYRRRPPSAAGVAAGGNGAGAVAARVRRSGGTLVAAGGCFDLLHAGHVALLQAARRLGDALVVCINSDDSVRRLKGPSRPLNTAADRAATLAALGCVDAVEVFDEDTPERVIRAIRPDVWVKGGDYDARSLPEAATVAEWGGQAVVLPYLAGRSTTGLLQRAAP